MPSDKKKLIVSILAKSGPLKCGDLRKIIELKTDERYPESTIWSHLGQLRNENEIELRDDYYHINSSTVSSENSREMEGAKILKRAGGKVHAHPLLMAFDPKVEIDKKSLDPDRIYFIIEFNSRCIYLSIEKDVVPFLLHISRFENENGNEKKIIKLFGKRTIVLKLGSKWISRYKSDDESGHAVLKLENKLLKIRDLNSTNKPSFIQISNLTFDLFNQRFSFSTFKTAKNKSAMPSISNGEEFQIDKGGEIEIRENGILKLSDECQIAIFFNSN